MTIVRYVDGVKCISGVVNGVPVFDGNVTSAWDEDLLINPRLAQIIHLKFLGRNEGTNHYMFCDRDGNYREISKDWFGFTPTVGYCYLIIRDMTAERIKYTVYSCTGIKDG